MKIVIFGGTGIVGKAIVNESLRRGHEITLLTRDKRKVGISHPLLHIIEGKVRDQETIRQLLQNQDAVIQSLGIGGKGNGKPTTFVSDTNKIIMDEMEQNNIKRFLAISVIGAGDSWKFLLWAYRQLVLPLFMKWFKVIIDDKNRMENDVKKSKLDWTLVRCTTIKDKPAMGKINATLDGKKLKFSITAADMASFVVTELEQNKYIKHCPTISN